MGALADARRFAALILALWVLSTWAGAAHVHENCCDTDDDDAPCSICIAIHHVPVMALATAETFEAERDVIAWISPWIAIVPEEVFFDRPLARGPPSQA